MKKIILLLLTISTVLLFNSCEEDLKESYNLNYITFEVIPQTISVLKDQSTDINVSMFVTQASGQDRSFGITISDLTTLDPTSYTVPSSIIIPANATQGMIAINFSDNNLSEKLETLVLDLSVNSETIFKGKPITIKVQKTCALNSINDLVGTFSVTDDINGYENQFTTISNNDSSISIEGIGESFIEEFWGEPITSSSPITVNVDIASGVITIPRQYIYTTTYDGDDFDYEIAGSGSWGNCEEKPTLTIAYDIYYAGDEDGIAKDYEDYLSQAILGGKFTRD